MNSINVGDFVFLCTERGMLGVKIWSGKENAVVWSGAASEIPAEYRAAEVGSFAPPDDNGYIEINID